MTNTDLAKVGVEGSNPFARSSFLFPRTESDGSGPFGQLLKAHPLFFLATANSIASTRCWITTGHFFHHRYLVTVTVRLSALRDFCMWHA